MDIWWSNIVERGLIPPDKPPVCEDCGEYCEDDDGVCLCHQCRVDRDAMQAEALGDR